MTAHAPHGTPVRRRPEPRAGSCSRCGCTDLVACLVDPAAIGQARVCRWVDLTRTLCSRCLRPDEQTPAQQNEIGRLRAYKGRVQVRPGYREGDVDVILVAQGVAPPPQRPGRPLIFAARGEPAPVLTLDRYGRIVGRSKVRLAAAA